MSRGANRNVDDEVVRVRARLQALDSERVALEAKLDELERQPLLFADAENAPTNISAIAPVTSASSSAEKASLFHRLFAGRVDVLQRSGLRPLFRRVHRSEEARRASLIPRGVLLCPVLEPSRTHYAGAKPFTRSAGCEKRRRQPICGTFSRMMSAARLSEAASTPPSRKRRRRRVEWGPGCSRILTPRRVTAPNAPRAGDSPSVLTS